MKPLIIAQKIQNFAVLIKQTALYNNKQNPKIQS